MSNIDTVRAKVHSDSLKYFGQDVTLPDLVTVIQGIFGSDYLVFDDLGQPISDTALNVQVRESDIPTLQQLEIITIKSVGYTVMEIRRHGLDWVVLILQDQ